MNIETIQNKAGVSSLEIAEITGKQHAHVMRDIREQFEKLQIGQSKFGSSYINDQNKEQPCFILSSTLTYHVSELDKIQDETDRNIIKKMVEQCDEYCYKPYPLQITAYKSGIKYKIIGENV